MVLFSSPANFGRDLSRIRYWPPIGGVPRRAESYRVRMSPYRSRIILMERSIRFMGICVVRLSTLVSQSQAGISPNPSMASPTDLPPLLPGTTNSPRTRTRAPALALARALARAWTRTPTWTRKPTLNPVPIPPPRG